MYTHIYTYTDLFIRIHILSILRPSLPFSLSPSLFPVCVSVCAFLAPSLRLHLLFQEKKKKSTRCVPFHSTWRIDSITRDAPKTGSMCSMTRFRTPFSKTVTLTCLTSIPLRTPTPFKTPPRFKISFRYNYYHWLVPDPHQRCRAQQKYFVPSLSAWEDNNSSQSVLHMIMDKWLSAWFLYVETELCVVSLWLYVYSTHVHIYIHIHIYIYIYM